MTEDELALSRVIATRAAQLAAETTSDARAALPGDAAEIRQQILEGGARWVGLEELLDYCWAAGIPVLHVDHFPKSARRPDGFAARVRGRPVIVLCRREKHSAWLLFILAHELGHAALGHVPEDGVVLDEHIDESSRDKEEWAGNAFAVALLTGSPGRQYVAANRWPKASELADAARQIGRTKLVDSGHIALNSAHSMGKEFFRVGRAALTILEPHTNAVAVVRERMAERLDWSKLPEDSHKSANNARTSWPWW